MLFQEKGLIQTGEVSFQVKIPLSLCTTFFDIGHVAEQLKSQDRRSNSKLYLVWECSSNKVTIRTVQLFSLTCNLQCKAIAALSSIPYCRPIWVHCHLALVARVHIYFVYFGYVRFCPFKLGRIYWINLKTICEDAADEQPIGSMARRRLCTVQR